MNSQLLRLKWHFEMLDKYRPSAVGSHDTTWYRDTSACIVS